MFGNQLASMAEAETYRDEASRLSPKAKALIDAIIRRMGRRGQEGKSVNIWNVTDLIEDALK